MKNRNLTIIKHKSWLSILVIISALILTWLEKGLNQGDTNYLTLSFIFLTYSAFGLTLNADNLLTKFKMDDNSTFYSLSAVLNLVICLILLVGIGSYANKNLLEVFTFHSSEDLPIEITILIICLIVIISIINLFTHYNNLIVLNERITFIDGLVYFPRERIKLGPILYPKKIIIMKDVQEVQPIEKDIVCHEGIKKVLIKLKVKNITGKVPRYSLNTDIDTVLMEIKKSITVDLMNSSKEKTLLENLENIIPLDKDFLKGGYKFKLIEKELIIKNSLPPDWN